MKVLFAFLFALSLTLAAQTTNRQPSTPPANPGQSTNRQPNTPPANPGQTTNRQPAPLAEAGMPKPAPEMERVIKMLQGRWNTEEKHEPSDVLPQGGTGKGQEGIRPGPGKLSLIAEYTSQGPVGEFNGIGIMMWNPADRTYRLYWTDNTAAVMTEMVGRWQGEDLVFTGAVTMNGRKVFSRHAFTEIKPDSFTYTIDSGPAANQLKRSMTIKYTRLDMQRLRRELGTMPQ